jgi:hypothetical protein
MPEQAPLPRYQWPFSMRLRVSFCTRIRGVSARREVPCDMLLTPLPEASDVWTRLEEREGW